jgi:hypothetical protein
MEKKMKLKIQGQPTDEHTEAIARGLLRELAGLGFEITDESELEDYSGKAGELYDRNGRFHQLAEECSELAVAASHAARGRDGWEREVATEIADVEMMIDGVRSLVSEDELEAARRRQLDRAWAALGAEIIARRSCDRG